MGDRTILQESVTFRRSAHAIGIEMLDVTQTDRDWRWLHTAFGIAVLSSWNGEVQYRGRRIAATDGALFCTVPGEIHSTPRVYRPGDFAVFVVEPALFVRLWEESGRSGNFEWKEIVARSSRDLLLRLERFFSALRDEASQSAMQVESSLCELFEALAGELLEGNQPSARRVARGAAEVAREAMHSLKGSDLSLQELAEVLGLSRFQTLRAFKRRYGVPPHVYQLCYKLSVARALLHEGWSAASVAMECGFADQSHFGRHFRQFTGTTPARYVKMTRQKQERGSLRDIAADDLVGRVLKHSDSRTLSASIGASGRT